MPGSLRKALLNGLLKEGMEHKLTLDVIVGGVGGSVLTNDLLKDVPKACYWRGPALTLVGDSTPRENLLSEHGRQKSSNKDLVCPAHC